MLVNSAADWGRSDPLLTVRDRRGDARGRVHRRRRRPGALAQPGRVLRPVRPARPRPTSTAGATFDGQLDRCAAVADAAAPSATGRPSTCPTAPTCTRPRTSPASSPSSTRTRVPIRRAPRTPTCSASACGWPRRSPPSSPPTPRLRRRLRARARRARAGGGDPQRLPVRRRSRRRWSSTPSTTRTGPTARPAGLHPGPGPGPGRPAARRRRPRLDLDAAAGLARRRGTPAAADAAAGTLDELAARAGRHREPRPAGRSGSAFEPEPGCVVETTDAGRRPRCPAWTPSGSASASTWPTSPAPGRSRPRRWPGCARPGCRSSRCRCRPRWRPPTRSRAAEVLRALRRAALPAPDPRPRRRRPPTTCDEALDRGAARAVAGALPRAAARRARRAADAPPCRCCAPALRGAARRRRRRRATTSTSRPTPGTCCRRSSGPATPAELAAGHRRRAGLRPRRCSPDLGRRR